MQNWIFMPYHITQNSGFVKNIYNIHIHWYLFLDYLLWWIYIFNAYVWTINTKFSFILGFHTWAYIMHMHGFILYSFWDYLLWIYKWYTFNANVWILYTKIFIHSGILLLWIYKLYIFNCIVRHIRQIFYTINRRFCTVLQ